MCNFYSFVSFSFHHSSFFFCCFVFYFYFEDWILEECAVIVICWIIAAGRSRHLSRLQTHFSFDLFHHFSFCFHCINNWRSQFVIFIHSNRPRVGPVGLDVPSSFIVQRPGLVEIFSASIDSSQSLDNFGYLLIKDCGFSTHSPGRLRLLRHCSLFSIIVTSNRWNLPGQIQIIVSNWVHSSS